MHIIAETPRLIIREFLPEESEVYLNHFNDEQVTRYLPKRSRDERTGIFNKVVAAYALNDNLGLWGIFDKGTGDFIGSCLLRLFNDEPGITELGYSIEQKYWGSGIGTEMAVALVKRGFADPNTLAIVAVTVLENIGSQRVLEKAGLKRVNNIDRDGLELAFFKAEKQIKL